MHSNRSQSPWQPPFTRSRNNRATRISWSRQPCTHRLPQRCQKTPAILVITENRLPLVPTRLHMVNRAGIFNPQRSGN